MTGGLANGSDGCWSPGPVPDPFEAGLPEGEVGADSSSPDIITAIDPVTAAAVAEIAPGAVSSAAVEI